VGGLGGGVSNALKDWPDRCGDGLRQQLGQKSGLIESALAFARRMERHGDNQIEVPATQTRIAHGFTEPAGDGVTQVALLRVFEFVHEFAN